MNNIQNQETQKPQKNNLPIILLVVVVILSLAAAALIALAGRDNETQPQTTPAITEQETTPQADATLLGEYEPQNVAPQEVVTVSVYVNSETPILSVGARLQYPTDKLEFVSIDTEESAFNVEAVGKEENGIVRIERANFDPLTGKQLVANVQFKVLAEDGTTEISFTDDSEVLEAKKAENILGETSSLQIKVGEN